MLLNQSQANAIAQAFSALNNVGAIQMQTQIVTKTERFKVKVSGEGVYIQSTIRKTLPTIIETEGYSNFNLFCEAYKLI